MKTYNKHPHWFNKPLRLNTEERQQPILIVDDFFQSYHLHEVREILWNWMVEVISSPHSISTNHHNRNNHIHFYEKLEALIEASFIIRKKVHKHFQR